MSDTIELITPTKGRLEQLSLVVECLRNQTRKADEWVIADDGDQPMPMTVLQRAGIPVHYIHYKSGLNISIGLNVARALSCACADKYIIIEDDDYYPPVYVENLSKLLNEPNILVGSSRWPDYRLSTGCYRVRFSKELAELHSTGIAGEELKAAMVEFLLKNPSERYVDAACRNALFRCAGSKFSYRLVDFDSWASIALKDYGVGTPGVIRSHRSDRG